MNASQGTGRGVRKKKRERKREATACVGVRRSAGWALGVSPFASVSPLPPSSHSFPTHTRTRTHAHAHTPTRAPVGACQRACKTSSCTTPTTSGTTCRRARRRPCSWSWSMQRSASTCEGPAEGGTGGVPRGAEVRPGRNPGSSTCAARRASGKYCGGARAPQQRRGACEMSLVPGAAPQQIRAEEVRLLPVGRPPDRTSGCSPGA